MTLIEPGSETDKAIREFFDKPLAGTSPAVREPVNTVMPNGQICTECAFSIEKCGVHNV